MKSTTKPTIVLVALLLALALGQAACLKTRSQIKSDQDQATDDTSNGGDAKNAAPARAGNYELEEMKNEITRVSGKLDEIDHNQKTQNVTELKDYLARLDARVADLEKNQVLVMDEVKALKDQAASNAQVAKAAATPASDLMSQANQLLSEKKCDEAADKYREVLGKAPKGKDAAEAHFGAGEALYCAKDYKKAIVQYSKVQESFAKSARIPQSLYKIALSFQHLNMAKESKGFFNELIERYPKSNEAKKARAKVQE